AIARLNKTVSAIRAEEFNCSSCDGGLLGLLACRRARQCPFAQYIAKQPTPSTWAPSTLSARAVKAGLGVATWAASSPIDPAVNSFGNVIACYDEQFYAALYSPLRHFTPKSPRPINREKSNASQL